MEAETALVRAQRAVHLHAKTTVDVDLSLVVLPRHAEHHDPLGLDQPFENARPGELRTPAHHKVEAAKHLLYGLVELGLGGVLLPDLGEYLTHIRGHRRTRGPADQHDAFLS